MANPALFYTVFQTRWGWFGLLGDEDALHCSILPAKSRKSVLRSLLDGIDAAYRPDYKKEVQKAIQDYFEGKCIDFSSIPVFLDRFSDFRRAVLKTLQRVKYGELISYKTLSDRSSNPQSSRAVGGVLAANPLPLILPCHRVIRSDGRIGGFSAQGGVRMKQRLLRLEISSKKLELKGNFF